MAGKQDLKVCVRGTACFLLLPQETPGRSRLSDSCPVSWLSCVLDNDCGLANRDGSQEMLESVSQGLSVSRQTMLHPFPESEQASTSQALLSTPWDSGLAMPQRRKALTVLPQCL